MATYFHGAPEIQTDGLQTLYLMNPGYIGGGGGYSAEASSPTNMVFLNPAANSLSPASLTHAQQQQQHFVGIPLQQQSISVAAPDMSTVHGLLPRVQYNLWNPTPGNNSADLTSQLGLRRPCAMPSAQQGLSLSLSPQQHSYTAYRPEPQIQTTAPPAISTAAGGEEVRFSGSAAAAGASNGIAGLQGVLMGSKYLKAAQQLLDEVVNVGKGVKDESPKSAKTTAKGNKEGEDAIGEEACGKRAAELTTAERQELQMKKAKLVNMLDEVEQRYRQYHHQMQIVISSFEAIAGLGSAKTYTALALQTISKQFRCLRDAISGQIRATGKSLGEEDCLVGSKSEGGSRLRFVDHQLRQQRALQQLGMMQHNAWRPQRGLPERSVSVLRAWLFEHFLHPYPKDSDKHMLAKQTGLTRNQVSNWFINARVRLWKPMVEEMYLEETKEQQEQQNNGNDKSSKSDTNDDSGASKSSAPLIGSPTRTEQSHQQDPVVIPSSSPANIQMHTGYDEDDDDMINSKLKKARSNESLSQNAMMHHHHHQMTMDMKPEETDNTELFMRFSDGRRPDEEHGGYSLGGAFGAYSIGELGQFAPRFVGNGVSLTLGLPHCDGLTLSGAQPSFLSTDSIPLGRRLELSTEGNDYSSLNNNNNNSSNQSVVHHPPNGYDNLNSIQGRKRFAAQLLPDFVT